MQDNPVYISAAQNFRGFVETIAALRAPGGCPWDQAQTHQTIAKNMIEEAYEAVDAIEQEDTVHLREELGDVLLQVVLQSQIAQDAGEFTIADVVNDINEKIVRRHPHVFGPNAASLRHKEDDSTEEISQHEVLDIWDQVKLQEKHAEKAAQTDEKSQEPPALLDDVPTSLPALMQAQKISRKAVSAGFEWESTEHVWEQVSSEVDEFQAARGTEEASIEFGDILFSLVNVARKEGLDAESALRESMQKFRRRWRSMELDAHQKGYAIEELETEQLEELWQKAKSKGL